jgi:hypothetical protein
MNPMQAKLSDKLATRDLLEQFIDRNTLADALEVLSEICWEKASHVQEAWQDTTLATAWERAGQAIDKLSSREAVLNVSIR